MESSLNFATEDCQLVLDRSSAGETVERYEFRPWSENIMGYLGEHLRLTVTAKSGKTYSFFVKSLPFSNPEQRKICQAMRIIDKESKIYARILNHLPDSLLGLKWRPQSYFWTEDLLILEDLSLRGFSLTPERFDFPNSHVQSVLRSLATLHAASVVFEKTVLKAEIGASPELMEFLFEPTVSPDCEWFMTGLRAIQGIALAKFPERQDFIRGRFWDEMWKVFALIDESLSLFPCVLTHRDMWAKNLMFTSDLDCVLLDFQISRYLPQSYDVAMGLFLLQKKRDRIQNFSANLAVYHDQYSRVLGSYGLQKDQISLETLERGCKYFELMGLIMKAITCQICHLPQGFMGDLIQDPVAYKNFELIDRTGPLLALLERDEYYRSWMLESVEELLDYTMEASSSC